MIAKAIFKEKFPGSCERPVREADNLAAICETIV
jgi:hypothetical protein